MFQGQDSFHQIVLSESIVKLFGAPSFIEIYDQVLTEKECQMIISLFEKGGYGRGCTMGGYVPEHKKCFQIPYDFSKISLPTNIIRPNLGGCVRKYHEKYISLNEIASFIIHHEYVVQKYDGEEDGYKKFHCEHGPSHQSSRRILAWMIYLNNAKCGTEFLDHPNVRAKMGRCVIWPSGFTHVHKGVVPNKGLKYIATGWVTYPISDPTLVS